MPKTPPTTAPSSKIDPEDAANALDALTKGTGGTGLRVDELLAEMPPVLRDATERALRDPGRASGRAITTTLAKAGYQVSPAAVAKWRLRNGVTK